MDDEKLLTLLDSQPWEDIIPELTRYAHIKVAYKRRAMGDMATPKKLNPDDFVQDAIESVYDRSRNWNQEAYPTMIDFLKSIVDSKLSNWGRSAEFQTQIATDNVEDHYDITSPSSFDEAWFSTLLQELYRVVDEAGDDSEKLFAVLDGQLDGKKRREIAADWGMTVDEVTNAKKMLERRLRSNFDRRVLDNPNQPN